MKGRKKVFSHKKKEKNAAFNENISKLMERLK